MAKRHRDILAKLDSVAIQRYRITEKEVRTIERYLTIIQKGFGASTWQNVIDFDGPYATSIIIHEVVEIRWLQDRGFDPLRLETRALRQLVEGHKDAHEIIERLKGERL